MKEVRFTIPGEPMGKQRPRFGNGRTYTPKKTHDYEELVRWSYHGNPKLEGNVAVTMIFNIKIPASASKKKQAAMVGTPCTKKPDIDNLIKIVLDGLNGVAFEDDRSVTAVQVRKTWTFEPCTTVIIRKVD